MARVMASTGDARPAVLVAVKPFYRALRRAGLPLRPTSWHRPGRTSHHHSLAIDFGLGSPAMRRLFPRDLGRTGDYTTSPALFRFVLSACRDAHRRSPLPLHLPLLINLEPDHIHVGLEPKFCNRASIGIMPHGWSQPIKVVTI